MLWRAEDDWARRRPEEEEQRALPKQEKEEREEPAGNDEEELAGAFYIGYRHLFLPLQQYFTTLRPSSYTRRSWIRLSPIVQYSPLLPPVGVWAVSKSQCG